MFLAVYGEDLLRVRELAEDLVEKFVTKYDPARLNVEMFDFATSTKESLIPVLQAAPFLSEKRFLFLKNTAATLKKVDAAFWTDIFESLDGSTSLCFVDAITESSWKKSHLAVWLATQSQEMVKYFPVPLLSRSECISWIRARAELFHGTISEQIAVQIYDRVGNTSQDLAHEIHKLVTYAGGLAITSDMVTRLIPAKASSDFFGFLDLLSTASPEKVVATLDEELRVGTDAFGIFGGLLRQIRILYSVSCLLQRGVTDQKTITQVLGLHPYVTQKALVAIKGISHERLCDVFLQAPTWDRQMKMGISAEILTKRLIEALLFARIKQVS